MPAWATGWFQISSWIVFSAGITTVLHHAHLFIQVLGIQTLVLIAYLPDMSPEPFVHYHSQVIHYQHLHFSHLSFHLEQFFILFLFFTVYWNRVWQNPGWPWALDEAGPKQILLPQLPKSWKNRQSLPCLAKSPHFGSWENQRSVFLTLLSSPSLEL